MKYRILLGMASIALLSGCESLQTPQQRQQSARQQAASRYTEERVQRLLGQVEAIEVENGRLAQEVRQLREAVGSCNSQMAQLNSNMQALQAKQAREMQQTLKTVEQLLANATKPRPPTNSPSHEGPGREHVVQKGHTLSAIAVAYGTTVSAIKKANNLNNDNIYVGQKLFIPE